MKILKTNNFVSERIKVKPITNAEIEETKQYVESIKTGNITQIGKDVELYWHFSNRDEYVDIGLRYYDWYMLQNDNMMMFWNLQSQYYPFFFKEDIDDIMNSDRSVDQKGWKLFRAKVPQHYFPRDPKSAYDYFVKGFDEDKMHKIIIPKLDFICIAKEAKSIIKMYHDYIMYGY